MKMSKVVGFVCLVVLLGLMLTYCEGRKHFGDKEGHWRGGEHGKGGEHREGGEHDGEGREHWKGGDHDGEGREHWKGGEHDGEGREHWKGGDHGEGREHGWKHHEGEGRHHGGWRHRGHFRQIFANMSFHFVDDSLPPNVYVVLSDKGIEVKASYETVGNTTALTKVGLRVADKNVVVSVNGNMAIDGIESEISKFDSLEFENGGMKKRHGALLVHYGVYRVFMRVHAPCEENDKSNDKTNEKTNEKTNDENGGEHGRYEHREWERNVVPHIGMNIGVEKTAKVTPGGFIGARMAVDPAKYISAEAI